MKLYYAPGACSLIVRIILNELGLSAAFESVDLRSKKTASGNNYLEINAKGSVPALQLDSGEILTENAVIIQYLADTNKAYQLLPPIGELKRYRVLEWLNYAATDLHKGLGLLFNPAITPDMKEKIFYPLIQTKLKYVNTQLQQHEFILGNHFTLPDAYIFVILSWAPHLGVDLTPWKNITRYFDGLRNRSSIHASLKEEANA